MSPSQIADAEPAYPIPFDWFSPQLQAVIRMAAAELKLLIDVCGTGQWTALVVRDSVDLT